MRVMTDGRADKPQENVCATARSAPTAPVRLLPSAQSWGAGSALSALRHGVCFVENSHHRWISWEVTCYVRGEFRGDDVVTGDAFVGREIRWVPKQTRSPP